MSLRVVGVCDLAGRRRSNVWQLSIRRYRVNRKIVRCHRSPVGSAPLRHAAMLHPRRSAACFLSRTAATLPGVDKNSGVSRHEGDWNFPVCDLRHELKRSAKFRPLYFSSIISSRRKDLLFGKLTYFLLLLNRPTGRTTGDDHHLTESTFSDRSS